MANMVHAGPRGPNRLREAYQMLDAFVLQTLREGGGQRLHVEAVRAVLQSLQLAQAVAEVVVGIAGHVHVPQGEVHPVDHHHRAEEEEEEDENSTLSIGRYRVYTDTASSIVTINSRCSC